MKPRTITVTLDEELSDLLDAVAHLQGMAPTEAVRVLLRAERDRRAADRHLLRAIQQRRAYRARLRSRAANSPEARRSRFTVVDGG